MLYGFLYMFPYKYYSAMWLTLTNNIWYRLFATKTTFLWHFHNIPFLVLYLNWMSVRKAQKQIVFLIHSLMLAFFFIWSWYSRKSLVNNVWQTLIQIHLTWLPFNIPSLRLFKEWKWVLDCRILLQPFVHIVFNFSSIINNCIGFCAVKLHLLSSVESELLNCMLNECIKPLNLILKNRKWTNPLKNETFNPKSIRLNSPQIIQNL